MAHSLLGGPGARGLQDLCLQPEPLSGPHPHSTSCGQSFWVGMGPLGEGKFHTRLAPSHWTVSSIQQEGRLDLSVMSPYVNHASARAENGDRTGVPSQDLGTPGQPIPKANDLSKGDGIISLVPSPSPRSRPPGAPVCLDPCSGPCAENGVRDSSRCSISVNSLTVRRERTHCRPQPGSPVTSWVGRGANWAACQAETNE